ncbi:hypothetical protein BC831DRAFT_456489, partial [Entophlyctis helioformis]
MDNASVCEHLQIVEWLHSNRTEGCTTEAIDSAARQGYLEIVKWLLEHRTEGFTNMAVIFADTDEIAALLLSSLPTESRNAMVQDINSRDSYLVSESRQALLSQFV